MESSHNRKRKRPTRLRLQAEEQQQHEDVVDVRQRQQHHQRPQCRRHHHHHHHHLGHILALLGISLAIVLVVVAPLSVTGFEDVDHFALRPFQASAGAASPRSAAAAARRQDNENIPVAGVPRQPLTSFVDDDEDDEEGVDDYANDHLTAPVPRGSGVGNIARIQPKQNSFKRIRLPDSVVALKPKERPATAPPPVSTFVDPFYSARPGHDSNEPVLINLQRVPNSAAQTFPPPPPTTPSPRQTFRRVKPQQSSSSSSSSHAPHRRVKPKNPATSAPRIQPSRTLNEPRSQLPITSSVANEFNRLGARGPINNGQRYRDDELFNKHNALDNVGDINDGALHRNQFNPQPPIEAFDDNGVLAIERVTSSSSSSSFQPPVRSSKVQQQQPPRPSSSVLTPTIPLTFYTTFTYLTTVFRGQHTALLSREQISSTVQVRPIDRSIVTAIEFNDGYIQPTRVVAAVPLGTKTKGATTTVYNMVSRVQVYNDDLYKVIYASKDATSKALNSALESAAYIEPTRTLHRSQQHLVSATRPPPTDGALRVADLEQEGKKLVSKYTYFFTIFDKQNTRYSTRVEESTAPFVGSIGSQPLESSIDGEGLLRIVSTKTAALPLASRVHNKVTTVVNLALNNYIKFDNLKDAKIDIQPTRLIVSPTRAVPSSAFHGPSSSSSSLEWASAVSASPVEVASPSAHLASNSMRTRTLESSLAPITTSKLFTQQQQQPHPTITSSIFVGQRPPSRRPGVRVKVKPIRSKVSSRLSSIAATTTTTASYGLDLSSSLLASPIRHPSSSAAAAAAASSSSTTAAPSIASVNHGGSSNVVLSISSSLSPSSSSSASSPNRNELISPTAVVSAAATTNSELAANIPAATPTLSRKKVAFTVRRPGVPGGNRFFSRRPSTLPARGVIGSTSSVGLISSSSSLDFMASSSSSIQPTPTLESSVLLNTAASSSSAITPSKSTKRKLVFTRISGNNVNNWNPIHSSRVRVSSRKVWKSSTIEQPIETILETTTHTVPFTLGAKTVYTTVEETNRRVVTKVGPLATPSLVEPSFVPSFVSSLVEPSASSSVLATEQLQSPSVLGNEKMTTVVETSDKLTISTLYSTLTYFATLFNGTQTRITPLEEIKTEYLTLREPVIVTRTIKPTQAFTTLAAATSSVSAVVASDFADNQQMTTQIYSTHTTLTHFITLFSGTRTILSSIEEISPTVVTKTVPVMATSQTVAVWSSLSVATSSASMPSYVVEEVSSSDNVQPSPATSASVDVVESIVELSPTLLSSSVMTTSTTATTTTAVIQPGSVIELNDILHGEIANVGQIGETIKDIVHKVVNAQDEGEVSTTTEKTTEVTTSMLQPSFETTVGSVATTTNKDDGATTTSTSPLAAFTAKNRHFTVPKYQHSHIHPTGISADEDKAIFSTESETNSEVTQYVTSIEKSTRTLILTSTKVYYTRDSPLTITSVLTTTFPPITYISTIIGSKTILGTYNSITPSKTSEPTVQATSVAPALNSTILVSSATPLGASAAGSGNRPRLQKVQKPKDSSEAKRKTHHHHHHHHTTRRPPTLKGAELLPGLGGKNITTHFSNNIDLKLCDVPCNSSNKEICKVGEHGQHTCECRPNYVRRPSDNVCQEIKNYLVTVRVSKTSESEISVSVDNPEATLQNYAKVARRQLVKGDSIAGLQVLSIDRSAQAGAAAESTASRSAASNGNTVLNMTVQLQGATIDVQAELSKKLQSLGLVERVVDFDECSSPQHHDCSPRARCVNKPGSYECKCLDSYLDLDPNLPGRLCVSEVKSCDYCYSRGDCWRHHSNTVCRCHPMYIGRRCEINGLLLAILVPILAISVIIAIICFLYCSRKLRQRNRRFKNLAAYGPVAVIGGTLDRKAMLETSSESSDPQHRSPHYASESNPASARGSMVRRDSRYRRESEPSLDRSSTSYNVNGQGGGGVVLPPSQMSASQASLPPQILIPRARPSYGFTRSATGTGSGGGGPFYVW